MRGQIRPGFDQDLTRAPGDATEPDDARRRRMRHARRRSRQSAVVRFRWWELALAVLLAGLAAIFFVADDVGGGIVLTALLVLGLASRATIVERQVAGSFAKRRGYLLAVQWIALAAIYVLFTVVMFIAAFEHWTRDRHGRVAVSAIAGMLFLLAREIVRRGEESNRWLA